MMRLKRKSFSLVLSLAMVFTSVNLPLLTSTAYAATANSDTTALSSLAASTGLKIYKLDGTETEPLTSGIYYADKNLTYTGAASTSASEAGGNGLKIADGATVYFYIPSGVTITATGGKGYNGGQGGNATAGAFKFTQSTAKGFSSFPKPGIASRATGGSVGNLSTGGGAAILVPSTSKLCIMGEGNILAQGGQGGNAGAGGSGSATQWAATSAKYEYSSIIYKIVYLNNTTNLADNYTWTLDGTLSRGTYTFNYALLGAGGAGGTGAAGGGAGIGSNGANGSAGTTGGASSQTSFAEQDRTPTNVTAEENSKNEEVNSSGTVIKDSKIAVNATGGNGGTAGSIGTNADLTSKTSGQFTVYIYSSTTSKFTTYDKEIQWYNGQPGAGGGAGGKGAGIGTGGAGGAGGQGGSSGSAIWTYYDFSLGVPTTAKAGASGNAGTDSITASLSSAQSPYNTVSFTGASSNATQNYYLSQTESITAPEYTNLQANQTFTGWKVTTAATALPSAFGETASKLASENTVYQPGETISTKGIYGNVTLTPQVATHNHSWQYKVSDNDTAKILAYCGADENSEYCSYYGESHAVTLTLTAPNGALNTSYAGASVDNKITSVTGASCGTVTYVGVDGTNYTETTAAPSEEGTYEARVSIGGVTATKKFEIIDTKKRSANDVKGKFIGEEPTGSISVTVDCEELSFNYDMETSQWESDKKEFTVTNGCKDIDYISDYKTAKITVSYESESAFGSVVTGKLYKGEEEIAANTTSSLASAVTTDTYGLTIINNNPDKKASNITVRNNINKETGSKIGTISVKYGQPTN